METSDQLSQEAFERIERYLLNEMPETERLIFEKEIAEDRTLRRHLAEIRIILREVETSELRVTMNEVHDEIQPEDTIEAPAKSRKLVWWPWAVAASITFALGFWYLIAGQAPQERLYTAYFEPDPGLVTAMGASEQYDFDRGMVDYKMGEYASAIDRWEKLLEQKPKNDTLNYFLGASTLAAGKDQQAIAYFQRALESEDSAFTEDAWWYLGLTWLKQGEIEKAKDALQKSNKPEAKRLLEELGK